MNQFDCLRFMLKVIDIARFHFCTRPIIPVDLVPTPDFYHLTLYLYLALIINGAKSRESSGYLIRE